MPNVSLFGEQSLTLVAAAFADQATAADVANELRADLPQVEVDLIRPCDADFARKMEPEANGIWRTAIRSHVALGPAGLVVGVLAAAMLMARGWPAAVTSPLLTTIFLATLGLFVGLMLAGLLTLRPDRSRVTHSIRRRNRAGQWAVVAHPRSAAQSDRVVDRLRKAGGSVIRSM
jgi:hypothetical protein